MKTSKFTEEQIAYLYHDYSTLVKFDAAGEIEPVIECTRKVLEWGAKNENALKAIRELKK